MPEVTRIYLSPQDLMDSSFTLARQVYDSGFRPDFILALWRGGTPVGIMVQEFFEYLGAGTNHFAIRTSCYTADNQVGKAVHIDGLDYLLQHTGRDSSLLIVDDVFDTGTSIQATLKKIQNDAGSNTPQDIRVATPYFKPGMNRTEIIPDYYVHADDSWLVFPHEMRGLTMQEIGEKKPWMRGWVNSCT